MGILAIVLAVALIAIDQITKYVALVKLKPINSMTIIDGIFNLTYVENRGAAFGIMQDMRWFFVVLTFFFLCGIIYYYLKLPKERPYGFVRFSLVLVFAGAIGNFIDRVLRGYVVDFFHASFINFPVFNMADIYLVVGTILLAILLVFFIKDDVKEQEAQAGKVS